MELKFSVKGIPYIEFDEDTRLIFTKLSPEQTSYKWFSVIGGRQIITMKRNGRVFREVSERFDFITDVDLSGFPRGFTKNSAFTRKHFTYIRKVFANYAVNGFIHEKYLPDIEDDIANFGVRKPRKRKIISETPAPVSTGVKPKKKRKKPKKQQPKHKLAKTCKACQKEIFSVPSCGTHLLVGHDERWMPIVNTKVPCKHCGVFPGGRHHLYCPEEQCPRCKKKIVVCGCFY